MFELSTAKFWNWALLCSCLGAGIQAFSALQAPTTESVSTRRRLARRLRVVRRSAVMYCERRETRRTRKTWTVSASTRVAPSITGQRATPSVSPPAEGMWTWTRTGSQWRSSRAPRTTAASRSGVFSLLRHESDVRPQYCTYSTCEAYVSRFTSTALYG